MKKIEWPNNKQFAFTIVDDTDGAFLDNIKPVYDYLREKGLKTTKTVWVFPSKNHYAGDYISNIDSDYLNYLLSLKESGFEMAFHNAGSGSFTRDETIMALDFFKSKFGSYPKIHINHANNEDNLYWGKERFNGLTKIVYFLNKNENVPSLGTNPESNYFWGDYSKNIIKYIRNRTFNNLNTMKSDKEIVRKESGKTEFSNYWFSASDAMDLHSFKRIMTKKTIEKLEKENGCCILYTHFAYGFVDKKGKLDPYFKEMIDYIANKNGWFVSCSELLDYLLSTKKEKTTNKFVLAMLDIKWFIQRIFKKITLNK